MNMPQTSFLSEVLSGSAIPPGKRVYFQERLRNRLYSMVLSEFSARAKAEGLTQASVATRIQKRPEQVNRWLASPGNWTLDTVSDLLLAIAGSELNFSIAPLDEAPRNQTSPYWFVPPHDQKKTPALAVQSLEKFDMSAVPRWGGYLKNVQITDAGAEHITASNVTASSSYIIINQQQPQVKK